MAKLSMVSVYMENVQKLKVACLGVLLIGNKSIFFQAYMANRPQLNPY